MSLEKIVNKESRNSIGKIISDVALYSPVVVGSFLAFGASVALPTAIPMLGYTLGSWYEHRKKKKKFGWAETKKELYTGHIMGHVDYAMFYVADPILKAVSAATGTGLLGMIAASIAFNPGVTFFVNGAYETFYYLRDKIKLKNVILKPWNFILYVKEAYQNKVKKEIWTDTKNVFKYMSIPHAIQMHGYNWLPEKIRVVARLVQSTLINNPIYRIVVGGEKKGKKKKYETKKENKYTPVRQLHPYQNNHYAKAA